ncbi:MAG: histidine kinase [Actinomycetota bacterium]
MDRPRAHVVYLAVYVAALATATIWLLLGLLPALGAGSDAFHDWMHRVGRGETPGAEMAVNAAQASHAVVQGGQVVLDYGFSLFNLVVSAVLMRVRPGDRTASLLAVGMVGSAIAFNLQGHDALQVVPVAWGSLVEAWHVSVHVGSGFAYVFALRSFPDGALTPVSTSLLPLRLALGALGAVFLTGLLALTADDHASGLVVVFGIFIPLAGLAAQLGRYRRARSPDERQRSRVLSGALGLAVLVAIPLMLVTGSTAGGVTAETVEYEVQVPAAGVYFFRCDPHPEEMRGSVTVGDEGPAVVTLSAEDNRFDRTRFAMAADEPVEIRLTNHDADVHNVAIYRDPGMSDPLFVGKEFSGVRGAIAAFRIFRIVFALIPIALIAGLVRFRLWNIDRVINRALAFGVLAGLVSLAYLALVVGVGSLFGAAGRSNLVLSIAVTVVVAAAFQPLRDRARRVANRLVYGKRATPYELLSALAERVGRAGDLDQALPQLVRLIAEGTGAARAEVWVRFEGELIRSATWPEAGPEEERVALEGRRAPEIAGRDRVVPVSHRDEILGALAITKPAGDEVTPVEDRLLGDAAAQAGLLLKNVQLTAELQRRLSELARSRRRIVAAQDAERRRLERDIHDGAQQHLVALSMKLRRAQDLSATDPEAARSVMDELQHDTGDALQALRDLARGIHPPVLSDRGLEAALDAHARRCPLPVSVHTEGLERHDANLEATVYFCCSEAIQNAVKHADASFVEVEISQSDGRLDFSVRDDGRGFDPAALDASGLANIEDRLAAVSGHLEIDSAPGAGTTVSGSIPLPPPPPLAGV